MARSPFSLLRRSTASGGGRFFLVRRDMCASLPSMHSKIVLYCVLSISVCAAEKLTFPQLIQASHNTPTQFAQLLKSTLGANNVQKGEAVLEEGPDFIFAIEAPSRP